MQNLVTISQLVLNYTLLLNNSQQAVRWLTIQCCTYVYREGLLYSYVRNTIQSSADRETLCVYDVTFDYSLAFPELIYILSIYAVN